jgi:hypothetical protein
MAQADQPGNAGTGCAGHPAPALEAAGGHPLGGLLLFGGCGVLLDRWLDMTVMTPVGIVVGCLLGGYLVYLRVVRTPFGAGDDQNGRSAGVAEGEHR